MLGVISMLRIGEAREARGWTQEQLAQAIGTTQQTIQRWESGQTDPQVSKVEAISKTLGITMSFLLGIDSNGNESKNQFSASEQALVEYFRAMNPEYRDVLMKVAVAFAAMTEKN